jgi:hypothetical protein
VSGNPGGTPRNEAVTALARRYTVDAIRALVGVARLNPTLHPSATVQAASKLLDIGHGGNAGQELVNALHLHLLAVQQIVPASENDSLVEPPDIEAEAELAQWDQPGMLPQAAEALPDEALPLWDSYRIRRVLEPPDPAPESEGGEGKPPAWEPLRWPKQP